MNLMLIIQDLAASCKKQHHTVPLAFSYYSKGLFGVQGDLSKKCQSAPAH
jgi:hypothetical protein